MQILISVLTTAIAYGLLAISTLSSPKKMGGVVRPGRAIQAVQALVYTECQ